MDQQVKRVKRELIKHGAILDMYEDTMELPDGKQETWDFISHRKGAAAVVPVLRGWKDPDGKAVPECDRPHDTGDSGRFARQRDGGYQGMRSKGTGGGDRLLQRRSDQNLIP